VVAKTHDQEGLIGEVAGEPRHKGLIVYRAQVLATQILIDIGAVAEIAPFGREVLLTPTHLIHLSLSWADTVSHDCTAHAQRFLNSLGRVSRSLVLHLGIELGSDQDDDDGKPDPDHEADTSP
jgi:hypothetical protein